MKQMLKLNLDNIDKCLIYFMRSSMVYMTFVKIFCEAFSYTKTFIY